MTKNIWAKIQIIEDQINETGKQMIIDHSMEFRCNFLANPEGTSKIPAFISTQTADSNLYRNNIQIKTRLMDWPFKTKITNGLFLALTMLLLSNCSKQKSNQWDHANINSGLSKDLIYKKLDNQKEIFSALEKQDSLTKRTSDVSYFTGKRIDLSDTLYSKFNNCRAYFYHSDTLSINIGIGNGFGGHGFIIYYKNKKFYSQAYFSTDVIIEGAVEPIHKIVYQKLTLDKSNYEIGDSLFGKIEFKSIETDESGGTTEHFGKGNFRTKVSKF